MKREHCYNQKRIVQIAVVLLLLAAAAVLAKYLRTFESGSGSVTSDKFYFATDLTGDSCMTDSAGENPGNEYLYQDVQEETWNLYGGGAHEITIELRNYYDELRVTQETIAYEVSVTANEPGENGGQGTKIDDLAFLAEGDGEESAEKAALSGSLGTEVDGSYSPAVQKITLAVKAASEVDYEEGTVVTVSIQSTKPYKKEIRLHFQLYRTDTYLCYEIRDSVGSPYAELVLMANAVGAGETGGVSGSEIQPYLSWDTELAIDNTNSLTYIYSRQSGSFTQQNGMANRYMQISRALKAKESESIYFFKQDISKNYTQSQRTVELKDEKYSINIP